MEEIRINPFEATKEINIGFQYDHNAVKVIFDRLEDDNYYLKLQDKATYEAFPIENKEWIVTSTYTQQTLLVGQIYRKIDNELIAHTPVFRMNLKSSLPQSDKIKEVVPPAFQTAYDKIVETTDEIERKLENGEFNGKDGNNGKSAYEIAVENGFEGTEQEWLESLDYEHSEEFTQLANQVREDAEKSSQALELTNQNKSDVEKLVSDFNVDYDSKLQSFNTNATEKTEAFNENVSNATNAFNSAVQEANTEIDLKVQEATEQAEKAKQEADRATQATDGKLDKNQGTDNVGKVMVVGEDGELIPTEYKSGSDNKLIGTVEKSENPSVSDSYNIELMNLKFYGKSTQVTTNGYQLLNYDNGQLVIGYWGVRIDNLEYGETYTISGEGTYSYKISDSPSGYTVAGEFNVTGNRTFTLTENENIPEGTEVYLLCSGSSNLSIGVLKNPQAFEDKRIMIEKGSTAHNWEPYTGGQPSPSPEYQQDVTAIEEVSGSVNNGSGNEQPFSFTPPQPLYSTQDGSIADVVNAQSGQYEYNMSGAVVLDGSPDEVWRDYSAKNGFVLAQSGMTKGLYLKGWCNKFITQSSSSATTGVIFGLGTQDIYFVNLNDIATTVDEWKQWLSENPITVVYPLATPTTQPIPQETLAILRALKSNNGVTNVICNAPVSFYYEKSLQIIIQKIWNAIGQTNANILLNGGNN